MTPYSRGYAAALKAAAEVCEKQEHNPRAIKDEYWLGSRDSAYACKQSILSLPIEGEATNPGEQVVRDAHTEDGSKHCVEPARPGPCVVVPVEELKIVLDFFRKANWPDTRAGNAAYRLNNAMLAAAKEE